MTDLERLKNHVKDLETRIDMQERYMERMLKVGSELEKKVDSLISAINSSGPLDGQTELNLTVTKETDTNGI